MSRWTDCGNADCPECKEVIALQKDNEHRRIVARTMPSFRLDWSAEAYSNAQERIPRALAERREAMKYARSSRAKAREVRRVRRPLTPQQEAQALAFLQKRRKLRFERAEWLSEVWLELTNPTVLVASRRGSFQERLKAAINRAEFRLASANFWSGQNNSSEQLHYI